jgi:hypothetical protein
MDWSFRPVLLQNIVGTLLIQCAFRLLHAAFTSALPPAGAARNMFVDHKPFIYVWRPSYRFLTLVREFFVAGTRTDIERLSAQCRELSATVATLQHDLSRALLLVEDLRGRSDMQWQALERLLLCALREPAVAQSAVSFDETPSPSLEPRTPLA